MYFYVLFKLIGTKYCVTLRVVNIFTFLSVNKDKAKRIGIVRFPKDSINVLSDSFLLSSLSFQKVSKERENIQDPFDYENKRS